MADDRSRPGPGEVHDDDELADVLAAELQRYATGAVPVVPQRAPAPDPRARPATPASASASASASAPAPAPDPAPDPAPVSRSEPAAAAGTAPVAGPPSRRDVPIAPAARLPSFDRGAGDLGAVDRAAGDRAAGDREERDRGTGDRGTPLGRTGRRAADPPTAPVPAPPVAFERRSQHRAPEGVEEGAVRPLPSGEIELPVRRRSGFRPVVADATPVLEPIDRVLPTDPVALPEPTATLLEEMMADSGDAPGGRSARHAAPAAPPVIAGDPLRGTGPLSVPNGLYADWERSLRSIGRPRAPWDDAEASTAVHAPVDAPTQALRLPAASSESASAPASAHEPVPVREPEPEPAPAPERRRRGRRAAPGLAPEQVRDAARNDPLPEPLSAAPFDAGDDEGIDDVAVATPRISAATTGAIDLPSVEPRPRTAPVLIERVRTAILQLPVVPDSPTGTGPAALVGRWAGAFASPVLLLLAFGLSSAGAGPVGAVLAVAALVVLLPAAVRSAVWARGAARAMEERDLLGAGPGTVAAVLLLLARIAVAAVVLFASSALVAAWAARTGALGGSATTVGVAVAGGLGLVALLLALLPVRALGATVQVVGLLGVVGFVLLLLLLAPTTGTAAVSSSGALDAAVGGAAAGLVIVLVGADLVRWRTDLPRAVPTAVATVLAVVAAAVVLVAGLAVASGAAGDPADALAGALSDGTAADLAAPLGVVLLVGALVLPVLLIRSAGDAAVRLLGGGSGPLGVAATGLLAVAGGLGLVAGGADLTSTAPLLAGAIGAPVAAWAGVRTLASGAGGPAAAAAAGLGVLVGWAAAALPLLVPAVALPAGSGLVAAFVLGLVGGALARGSHPVRPPTRPGDTVEG